MKLSQHQQRKFASLLVNLSSQTASRILDRFDKATQSDVRSQMDQLSPPQPADEQLLAQFAEFLYFEPDQPPTRDTILKPDVTGHASRDPHIHRPARFEFQDLLTLGDTALDTLLETATPELTIAALCCSPRQFVLRVLDRLSPAEADRVQKQINQTDTIDWHQMQAIQQRICQVAKQLIESGAIER